MKAEYPCDHGEESIYLFKKPGAAASVPGTLIVVYADDFDIAGPEEDHVYDTLSREMKFDHAAKDPESELKELIGLEFYNLPKDPNDKSGLNRCVAHQSSYIQHIVEEYEERHFGGAPLRLQWTPLVAREERGSEEQQGIKEDLDAVPDYVPESSRLDLQASAG